MKCPWCNDELKDGSVMCPTCGNEINMVPEFDPEIEDKCRETIETMTKDIFSNGKPAKKKIVKAPKHPEEKKEPEKTESDVSKTVTSSEKINKDKSTKKLVLFIIMFVAIIIVAIVILVVVTSDSYKLSQAQKAYSAKEYDKAKGLYQVLIEKDSDNIELLDEYSYVLFASNDLQEYERVLYRIAESSTSDQNQVETAYERLIYIYSCEKEYAKIRELILSAGNETILDKYKDFLTCEPEIVLQAGTYDLPQMLVINANDEIHYSLENEFNGVTTILAEDEIYRLPILLEIGTYKLSTYTVNKYELTSDVIEAEYYIEIAPPIKPEVSLVDGTYISPQLLEVFYDSDNITVYYTSDGSEPGLTSQIYNGSIVVPFGQTTYSFVSVNEYGLMSEVAKVSVNMEYEYEIQPGTAMDLLITYLLEKGTIVSYDGTMPDGECLNLELKGFEVVDTNYCYVFEEVMIVDDIPSYLDVEYAVDMITGDITKID